MTDRERKTKYGYPADTPQKTTINYPFVYRIFSRCAKGIVIKLNRAKGGSIRHYANFAQQAHGKYLMR